jgi:ribose transport system permease protein
MNGKISVKRTSSVLRRIINDKVVIAYILVIVLFIVGQIIIPGFLSFSHVMGVLQASFFLGMIALAQTFVIISGKEDFDLSVGGTLTVGVIIGAAVLNGVNANLPLAIIAVILAGLFFGMINGLGIMYFKIAPLIMTLAMAMVIEGILLFTTKGMLYGKASPALEIMGRGFLKFTIMGYLVKVPWVIIIWIILIILAVVILNKTPIGYTLRGIGSNIRAAELLGIRVKVVKVAIYSFSGMISSLMGLFLLGYVVHPNISLGLGHKINYPILSILAVIIGGIGGGSGSYIGAVAGSIFLITLNSILVTLGLNEGARMMFTGLVLLILLVLYTRRHMEGKRLRKVRK